MKYNNAFCTDKLTTVKVHGNAPKHKLSLQNNMVSLYRESEMSTRQLNILPQ